MHKVAYPGYRTAQLNILISNLAAARRGEKNMQAYIAWQYFKALGLEKPPIGWEWHRFSITPTGVALQPPTPGVVKPRLRPETYGCTCPVDCASCENDWHGSCRHDCKYGQQVR